VNQVKEDSPRQIWAGSGSEPGARVCTTNFSSQSSHRPKGMPITSETEKPHFLQFNWS